MQFFEMGFLEIMNLYFFFFLKSIINWQEILPSNNVEFKMK